MKLMHGGARGATNRRQIALWPATLMLAIACWVMATCWADDDKAPRFTTETLRGRVVYLAEAMEKQAGVPSVPEAGERVLALQTARGDLVPILEDVRGRAFRRDDRLRKM